MAYGTVNADVIQSSVSGVSLGAGNASNFKNRIINGAMVIDQRNAGASLTAASGGGYCLDRYQYVATQSSKYTIQQNAGSVTPPTGFSNYLGVTSSSAYSVLSTDIFSIGQNIEGFNSADLAFGTINAKTITLSFWVYSSLTGTFGGSFENSAVSRAYPFTYTINSANTWEQKTITITGDTTGTWVGATNGVGLRVWFNLGAGSTYSGAAGSWASADYRSATGATSVVGTNGATWYVTGVQLEVGSSATGFEYRDYGTEFQLCLRYFYAMKASECPGSYFTFMQTAAYTTTNLSANFIPRVPMRAIPTLSTTGTASNYVAFNGGFTVLTTAPFISNDSNASSFTIDGAVASGLTQGNSYRLLANNNNTAYLNFSAEL